MTHMFQKILSEDDTRLAVMRNDAKRRVYPYEAPDWAKKLKGMPSSKIDICQKFTPVQRWLLPNIPEDFEVFIKRDDMTGGAISGHKVKKLEFHLAAALKEGYKTIIGGGGNVSNYCRSIAVAGKELGFHVHLVQSSAEEDLPLSCNIFISRMTGAQIHTVPECDTPGLVNKMQELAKLLHEIEGQPAYVLPLGFPGDPGIFAYIDTFHELFLQGVTREYTDLVVACYSGITTSAFIIGNYLTGGNLRRCYRSDALVFPFTSFEAPGTLNYPIQELPLNSKIPKIESNKSPMANIDQSSFVIQCKTVSVVHALSTRESKTQCQRIIGNILQKSGFLQHVGNGVDIGDLVSIVEASREPKYGVLYDEHIDFVRGTAASTGIILDPVYTGKTAYHMVKMIKTSPHSFKGKKILYYNSGSFTGVLSEDVLHNIVKENKLPS